MFTGWLSRIKGIFDTESHVIPVGLVITKADGSPDVLGSDGANGALVSLSSASTAALASQTTLAANLAQVSQPTIYTAVTAADATDLALVATKGLLIGGSGNLAVRTMGALTTTITLAVQPGQFVPGQFSRVMTATTATGIVALS